MNAHVLRFCNNNMQARHRGRVGRAHRCCLRIKYTLYTRARAGNVIISCAKNAYRRRWPFIYYYYYIIYYILWYIGIIYVSGGLGSVGGRPGVPSIHYLRRYPNAPPCHPEHETLLL